MVDNVAVTPGAGASIATDDVAGVHYQIVKQAYGALDSATLVSTTNGLPVQGIGNFAVTGTFWQATQPVSAASLPLPSGAATETTLAALNTKVTAVNTGAVTISAALPAGTNNIGDVDVLTLPAIPAGANTIGTTLGPTLTKATQGATGYSTQDLKDAGRTLFSCATVIAGVTAVTTEALLTMVPTRAGVASATVTTQSVTAGKTLRIQSLTVGYISTAAAVLSMRFALRMNPSGAVTATSPILRIIAVSQQAAALAQAGNEMTVDFPDGLEFSGTQQFGLTQIGSVATGTCWASLTGFEY